MENNNEQNNIIDFEKEKAVLDRVSELIQEAKPLYFKEKAKKAGRLRTSVAVALFAVTIGSFNFVMNSEMLDVVKYGQTLCAQDYGFPVDSYGLIMVDDEF